MFGKLFNRFKTKPAPSLRPPPPVVSLPNVPVPVPVLVPPVAVPAAVVPAPVPTAEPAADMHISNHTRIYKTTSTHVSGPANPESLFPSPTVFAPSPEELCGVTSDMSLERIKEVLAHLYRRHNRLSSSLNPQLKTEAEMMLDAIVDVRHKYFGEDMLSS